MAHRDAGKATKTLSKCVAVLATAAFVSTALLPVSQAQADHRRHYKGHDRVVIIERHRHHKPKRHHRGNRDGELLAAGILGLAVGAIIAGESSRHRQRDVIYVQPQPRYVEPAPIYREPRPIYREPVYRRPLSEQTRHGEWLPHQKEPRVITYEESVGYSYEPWSPGWAEWCRNRYRSFNATTGTFRGFDGQDHFCVVK